MGQLIVITGGPCGGKSTMVSWLRERLGGRAGRVWVVPEAARLALSMLGQARTSPDQVRLQELIVRIQLAMEEGVLRAAGRHGLVIEDRGVLDSRAYLGDSRWRSLRRRLALRERDLLARYRAVLHLTSCAVDRPEAYRQDNQRRESPRQARELDAALWRAWKTHPCHLRFDNGAGGWQRKAEAVLDAVFQLRSRGTKP